LHLEIEYNVVMANAHHSKKKYEQIATKNRGRKRSKETRERISRALLGHKFSEETLAKVRGRKRSPEFRERMRQLAIGRTAWNKGKTGIYSPETLKRLRDVNLGKKHSLESRKRMSEATIRKFVELDPSYVPPTWEFGEKARRHEQMRKYRLRTNGGTHTESQWENLKLAFDNQCKICGRKEPRIKLTKDHIIPLRNGGTNDIGNIQPLCRSCNSRKR
jgi:hypothetical protein